MTVKITSSNPISLVAGIGAEIDAPAVPRYTTNDIYPKGNPTTNLTTFLREIEFVGMVGSATIDGTAAASTTLHTIPTGQILLTVRLVFVLTAIAGSGNPPAISVGFMGFGRDLIDGTLAPGLFGGFTTPGQVLVIDDFDATGGNNSLLSGGDSLFAQVETAATYSEYALKCFVFGYQSGNSNQSSISEFNDYGIGLYGEDVY